jgi:hypothetical protein
VNWDQWVLDVTRHKKEMPLWVPISFNEDGTHDLVVGMNVFSDDCPGTPKGIIHEDGDDAVNEWIENNAPEMVRLGFCVDNNR